MPPRPLRAAPAPQSNAGAAIGASVGVGAVLVAVVLAALYTWHRLRGGRVPLIAWLTSGGKAPSSGGSGVRAGAVNDAPRACVPAAGSAFAKF